MASGYSWIGFGLGGLSKGTLKMDLWMKDIAPNDELREWFGHDTVKWPEFKRLYFKELDGTQDEVVDTEPR